MLDVLHIENIAVIKSLDIDFDSGFSVLTGETGAGKSIIIDAIKEDINGFLMELDGRTDNVEIQAAYTGTDKTEVLQLVKEAEEELGLKVTYVDPLSLSVSCHIGDGAIALTVVKK